MQRAENEWRSLGTTDEVAEGSVWWWGGGREGGSPKDATGMETGNVMTMLHPAAMSVVIQTGPRLLLRG